MGKLIDKIMVVNGDAVELSPEITERMEKIFNSAVDVELHSYFTDGVDTVLDIMEELNMKGSLRLVEEKLIEKKILISGDADNENEEEDSEDQKKKKRNPKRGSIKEYYSDMARMIG